MLKLYEKLKILQKTVNILVDCFELAGSSAASAFEQAHYYSDIESYYKRLTSLLWHPSEDYILVDTFTSVARLKTFLIAAQTTVKTYVPTPTTKTRELQLGQAVEFYVTSTDKVKTPNTK